MNNPTIEIGSVICFLPAEAEANDKVKFIDQCPRFIPRILWGEVIEKGIRWESIITGMDIKLTRIELLLIKDNVLGYLWSMPADRVLIINFQTNK